MGKFSKITEYIKNNCKKVCIAAGAVVLAAIAVVLFFVFKADKFSGKYDANSSIVFYFDGHGKGYEEVGASVRLGFKYEYDSDIITIKYDDKKYSDQSYIYEKDGDTFTLTSNTNDAEKYVLIKR